MLRNRRTFSWMLLALFASLFSFTAMQSSEAARRPREPRIEGVLSQTIGVDRIARVVLRNGQTVSLFIPATAKVERNNLQVGLSAFKAGDRVQARFTADGLTVIKFEGVGQ